MGENRKLTSHTNRGVPLIRNESSMISFTMPEKWGSLSIKFLKFGLVGLSGIVVDFGITFMAKERLHWNKYVANSLGFIFACTSNYILNRLWTFHSTNPQILEQYLKFILVSVVGLGLNNLLVYFLHDRLGARFYPSKLAAVALVMFWNFAANYLFTFKV
ncbi:GtrA family protein [Pontibacter ruber]|uniref:GtrA family protein n=1 Tax=Pontibacter ruber TaxID=1343895 RepID=A0ABW5D1B7_9BACT|nr:GtrA family protein [Pontibacter ruber]